MLRAIMHHPVRAESVGEELDRVGADEKPSFGAARNQFLDGLFSFFAVAERPFVDVHSDELIGKLGFHIASKLHGVLQCVFAMVETVLDTVANGFCD